MTIVINFYQINIYLKIKFICNCIINDAVTVRAGDLKSQKQWAVEMEQRMNAMDATNKQLAESNRKMLEMVDRMKAEEAQRTAGAATGAPRQSGK